MGLTNVEAWHGRIEAFDRHFDICISLHACGSASDAAIEASIKVQAPYIISPCCVGKINLKENAGPSSMLARPRSNWLRNQLGPAAAAAALYQDIAARADRSETKATAGQRGEDPDGIMLSRRCKALVELDRNERAAEGGNFSTALLTLRDMDEDYAKTDVLVGVPASIMGAVVASDTTASGVGGSAIFDKFISPAVPKFKGAMSDAEWRDKLTTDAFNVLRRGDTEPPYFSEETPGQLEYNLLQKFGHKYPQVGGYRCAGCQNLLFFARSKFGSRCGWPSFWSGVPEAIQEKGDGGEKGASKREIMCGSCGGHLGHVFRGEGIRGIPVDSRYCVNGVAITYDDTVEQPATLPSLPPYLRLTAIPP